MNDEHGDHSPGTATTIDMVVNACNMWIMLCIVFKVGLWNIQRVEAIQTLIMPYQKIYRYFENIRLSYGLVQLIPTLQAMNQFGLQIAQAT